MREFITMPLSKNLELELHLGPAGNGHRHGPLADELASFSEFGQATRMISTEASSLGGATFSVPTYVNEFWTARQRQANPLHEISYRACFKPQLPRFFIERLRWSW